MKDFQASEDRFPALQRENPALQNKNFFLESGSRSKTLELS
jgi:hypothetical protein